MLLHSEAQSFDDGALFCSFSTLSQGRDTVVCQDSVKGFFFLIQGAWLLREPVITPAISITLF